MSFPRKLLSRSIKVKKSEKGQISITNSNQQPRAKRELNEITVNQPTRAKQGAEGIFVNLQPRAEREPQGILVNLYLEQSERLKEF